MTYAEALQRLDAMRRPLALTRAHAAEVRRQIKTEAEDRAMAASPRTRCGGRGSTRWQVREERQYQRLLIVLTVLRQPELDALARKADRQRAAIEAFIAKHRFNEPLAA